MTDWLTLVWLVIAMLGSAAWLGSAVAFGAVTAPVLFRELDRHQAGGIVGHLLPRTQALGWWSGVAVAVALSIAAFSDLGAASIGFLVWSLPLLLALLLWWVGWRKLGPHVERVRGTLVAAREAGTEGPDMDALETTFADLHRLSTRLFAGALLLVVVQAIGACATALGW